MLTLQKKLFAAVIVLCILFVGYEMLFTKSKNIISSDEVPVFITIGQSNADGSAFADEAEDKRLSIWYDDSLSNPKLMKIWYRSSYIVNQENGARWVFDGSVQDVAPGWLDLYYKNDHVNGRTMMNMIHSYGTWSEGAAGRRGMEGEFGMHFQQAFPDQPLYIIKLGCSGSQIETWASPQDSHNWNYFYDKMYLPAIESLLSQGKKPRLAGIWWMQGEGNGSDSKEEYLPLLKNLIYKCRTELGFPEAQIYLGRVVKPGENTSYSTASTQFGQGVRDAQDAIVNPKDANYMPYVTLVDNRDCPFDADNLHYSHIGVNKIGLRLADLVIRAGRNGQWAEFSESAFKRAASSQHAGANHASPVL